MGMSASQARLLNLQARQNNVEYQGQQINQERTILSQQCTDLYNSLLNMKVPTPPSTQDFTTIQYAGVDGATTFTLGNIVPTGDTYTVEMNYKKTGHYLQENGSAMVTEVPQFVTMNVQTIPTATVNTVVDVPPTGEIGKDKIVPDGTKVMAKLTTANDSARSDNSYRLVDGKFVKVSDDESGDDIYILIQAQNATNAVVDEGGVETSPATSANYNPETDYQISTDPRQEATGGINKSEILGLYVDAGDGNPAVKITEDNLDTYFKEAVTGSGVYEFKGQETTIFKMGDRATVDDDKTALNPDFGEFEYYVADQPCMTLSRAKDAGLISDKSYTNYIDAIKASHPEYAESSNEMIEANFRVYFTKSDSGLQVPHFVSTTDLTSGATAVNGNKFVATSDYTASGSYTSSIKETGCQLTFDTSGRITEIKIPTNRNDAGEALSWKTVELEASSVTDNAAYQDAYAKYEYAQYEYDRKQQEINAKTEVIQQQDRNLELKLQRLDNERTQIKTEIEAVEKVINDNIESTYKTFSG